MSLAEGLLSAVAVMFSVPMGGTLMGTQRQRIAIMCSDAGHIGIFCYKRAQRWVYIAAMPLDQIDNHILDVLQKDGRISNQDLADQVGLSPSPCLRRLRALESTGVVRGYAALIDPATLGQRLQAIIEVRLEHQTSATVARFEKEIVKYPQVLECYQIAGDWDYALLTVARDLEDFREFCVNSLAKIPGVGNVKSNICMKQVKYSTVLPLAR